MAPRSVQPATTLVSMPLSTVNVPAPLLEGALNGSARRALRAYLVVRALDGQGRGRLRRDVVLAGLAAFGLARSTRYEWLDDLLADGRFARLNYATEDGSEWIVFAAIADVLAAFGVQRSRRDVKVPVPPLLTRQYRRALLNAARAPHGSRRLARATVQDRLGASPTTQRRAERDVGVRPHPNLQIHELNPHSLGRLPAIDGKRVFLHGGQVLERLPNSTSFPQIQVVRRRRHSPDQGTGESSGSHRRQDHRGMTAGSRGRPEPGPRRGKGLEVEQVVRMGRDWVTLWQEPVS